MSCKKKIDKNKSEVENIIKNVIRKKYRELGPFKYILNIKS